jgi:hypothetical protein
MLQGIMLSDLARNALTAVSAVNAGRLLKAVRPSAGLLIGPSLAMVGAGIAIGLMIAPCSGRQARGNIWSAVQNGLNKIKSQGQAATPQEGPIDPHATRRNGEALAS